MRTANSKNKMRLTLMRTALRTAMIPLCIMFSASSSGAESAEQEHCITLKPNTYFAVTSFINTSSAKTIKVSVDDQPKETLTGAGASYFAGSRTLQSGKGKVCVTVETNKKPNPLSFVDDPLKGKPLTYIIGAEDGTDNDFNDAIVYITPLEGNAGNTAGGGGNGQECGDTNKCKPWGIGKYFVGDCVEWEGKTYKCIEDIHVNATNWTPENLTRYWQFTGKVNNAK